MTDMIEKMARAIHAASYHPDDLNNSIVEEHWEVEKGKAFKRAKAALSALEDPSEGMLRAVEPRPSHWPKRGESPKHDAAVDTDRMCTKGKFVRMIKAAKGEE